jgi:glucose-6-phosphate isomerase
LVNINAYHQPGVEAGKKAAGGVLQLQREILELLGSKRGEEMNAEECAEALGKPEEAETVFIVLRHLAANPDRGIAMTKNSSIWDSRFKATS